METDVESRLEASVGTGVDSAAESGLEAVLENKFVAGEEEIIGTVLGASGKEVGADVVVQSISLQDRSSFHEFGQAAPPLDGNGLLHPLVLIWVP